MWVFRSNVARIILFLDIGPIGIQSRCRNKNTLITMVGPTIIFMTNGSSMPYPQSVCAHGKAVVLDITVSER